MTGRPIRRNAIRTRQHRRCQIRNGGAMGADIAALIMKEFVIDCEDTTVAVDGGPDAMKLLARMVGGSNMFTTIFDPFHRPAEAQGRETYQHVLGIKLTANAKSTADMTLEEIYAG